MSGAMDEVFVTEVVQRAMDSLLSISEDEEVSAKDRIAANKVLLESVSQNYHDIRKVMMTNSVMPLMDTVSKSLNGTSEQNSYSPVYELSAVDQCNLALNLVRNLND